MGNKKIIALLRMSYGDELETVMNYLMNLLVLDGVRAEETKEPLRVDIQEELGLAEQLGRRLNQLDASPLASVEFECDNRRSNHQNLVRMS
jgi:bacterioferritin